MGILYGAHAMTYLLPEDRAQPTCPRPLRPHCTGFLSGDVLIQEYEDDYGDCVKRDFYAVFPDGSCRAVDISPYLLDAEPTVALWLYAGCPRRVGIGPLTLSQIARIAEERPVDPRSPNLLPRASGAAARPTSSLASPLHSMPAAVSRVSPDASADNSPAVTVARAAGAFLPNAAHDAPRAARPALLARTPGRAASSSRGVPHSRSRHRRPAFVPLAAPVPVGRAGRVPEEGPTRFDVGILFLAAGMLVALMIGADLAHTRATPADDCPVFTPCN